MTYHQCLKCKKRLTEEEVEAYESTQEKLCNKCIFSFNTTELEEFAVKEGEEYNG